MESLRRYKRYRNVLIDAIRKAKQVYYQKILVNCKSDGKETWRVLNEIIGRRKEMAYPTAMRHTDLLVTDEAEIANILNDFFVRVGPAINDSVTLNDIDPLSYIKSCSKSIFLTPTDSPEIQNIIDGMGKTAAGADGITGHILKLLSPTIVKPLVHITNLCFLEGKFPDNLKSALVVPIYKSGDKPFLKITDPSPFCQMFPKLLREFFINEYMTSWNQKALFQKHNLVLGEGILLNMQLFISWTM